ncbi:RDD family protein [Natronorubrum sp. DTA28]|uniref:RDD family protein n=1 Tax=Natronorubrum sp. DTA28 TaxID=3447019 RepID=UPI003F84F910
MSVLDWIPTKRVPDPDPESASPALLKRRAIATVIDLVICYVLIETAILAVLMVVFLEYFLANTGEAVALSVVGLVPVYLLYTFAFEWRYARTPGKKRMGILVVDDDGSRLSARSAAIRNVLRYVDWLPFGYVLGWLSVRRSPRGRRLGDRLAGTLVVRPVTEAQPLYSTDRAAENADEQPAE